MLAGFVLGAIVGALATMWFRGQVHVTVVNGESN